MNTYVVTGMLTGGKTLQLDESVPLPAGKVRVTVEAVVEAAVAVVPPKQPLQEWLDDLHRRRAAAGVPPMTPEQIEEWVADVRSGRGH
jgi:hypothetical protein